MSHDSQYGRTINYRRIQSINSLLKQSGCQSTSWLRGKYILLIMAFAIQTKNPAAPSSGELFSILTGAAEILIFFVVLRVLSQFLFYVMWRPWLGPGSRLFQFCTGLITAYLSSLTLSLRDADNLTWTVKTLNVIKAEAGTRVLQPEGYADSRQHEYLSKVYLFFTTVQCCTSHPHSRSEQSRHQSRSELFDR